MANNGTSGGFQKLRHALMANKFATTQDNVPVAVDSIAGLFIGSFGTANNLEALTQARITHILCVSSSLPLPFPHMFTYKQLDIADHSSVTISAVFNEACDFIDTALSSGGNVLVHCFLGRSRSATIILAYFIIRQHCTLATALSTLRQVRPQVQPNSGFWTQLKALEAKHKGRF